MENKKMLFIVSSNMYPNYADALEKQLNISLRDFRLNDIHCELWKDGTFKPGYGYLETLSALKPRYVVALVTPDDKAVIKGTEYIVARDNVIFEYGLFMGKLGRDKTFLITPENTPELQIMSDLKGVQTVKYHFSSEANADEAKRNLESAAHKISALIYGQENPPGTPPSPSPNPSSRSGRRRVPFPPM